MQDAVVLVAASIDDVTIPVNDGSVWIVRLILALLVFGVAIDLDLDEFRETLRRPRGPAIGMVGQLLLLPAATWGLTMILPLPTASVALGMIIVAAAPGGAISNFIAHLANGNASLSIGMTGLSTIAAIVMTPANIWVWTRLNPDTRELMDSGVSVNLAEFAVTIVILIALPVALGILTQVRRPQVAARMQRPAKLISILVLVGFIIGAVVSNTSAAPEFFDAVGDIGLGVVLHNAIGMALGYGLARATSLNRRDARAISIEVGMQNAALALGLILSFFEGLGGAAVVAATYSVWHTVSGLIMASWWRMRDRRNPAYALG